MTSIFITHRIYAPSPHTMMVVMKMKKQLTRTLATGLDIPAETMCSLPVSTLRGREDLTVENHRGILGYSGELIQVAVKGGSLLIYGKELTIAHMTRRCLQLKGRISRIEWE